ncbi:hypothetical protein ACF0H5_017024 [Mactra antiquata]
MATEDNTQQPDDRWSGFVDPERNSFTGRKTVEDPGPDLSEYLEKVIQQRSPRKQHERMYKMVANFVQLMTNIAYALTSEWKLFLQTNKKGNIRTTDLRTLSVDRYECMVPLTRPLKPDAFQISTKSMVEMSPHRCFISLNNNLSNEERKLVSTEWDSHIDKHGYLNTRRILKWFNNGLSKASAIILAESKNIANLRCVTSLDGTAVIHVAFFKDSREADDTDNQSECGQPEVEKFSVNLFPVYVVDKIPASIKVNIPLPTSRAFGHIQKQTKESIANDLEAGKHMVFLEPKKELSVSSSTPDGPSWAYNMNFVERYVYNILDEHCEEVDYRQVIILFDILREHYPVELAVLNTEIVVNALFAVSRKHFSKLEGLQDWFIAVFQYLINGFKSGFLSSFYLQRQNLLMRYDISEHDAVVVAEKLGEIIKAVQAKPKSIYQHTGYEEKKKGKNDSEDSDSDSDESDKELDEPVEDVNDGKDNETDSENKRNAVSEGTDNGVGEVPSN